MEKSSWSEEQIPQLQKHRIRKLLPRTPGEILLALLAFFSFWSTAAVEIAAGLMILLGILTLVQTFRNPPADPTLRARLVFGEQAALILLAIYLISIIESYISQHIPSQPIPAFSGIRSFFRLPWLSGPRKTNSGAWGFFF